MTFLQQRHALSVKQAYRQHPPVGFSEDDPLEKYLTTMTPQRYSEHLRFYRDHALESLLTAVFPIWLVPYFLIAQVKDIQSDIAERDDPDQRVSARSIATKIIAAPFFTLFATLIYWLASFGEFFQAIRMLYEAVFTINISPA